MYSFEEKCEKSSILYNYTIIEIYRDFEEWEIDREGFEHIPI